MNNRSKLQAVCWALADAHWSASPLLLWFPICFDKTESLGNGPGNCCYRHSHFIALNDSEQRIVSSDQSAPRVHVGDGQHLAGGVQAGQVAAQRTGLARDGVEDLLAFDHKLLGLADVALVLQADLDLLGDLRQAGEKSDVGRVGFKIVFIIYVKNELIK